MSSPPTCIYMYIHVGIAFMNRHTCGCDCYWRLCSEVEQNLSPVQYMQYIHACMYTLCELPLYGCTRQQTESRKVHRTAQKSIQSTHIHVDAYAYTSIL